MVEGLCYNNSATGGKANVRTAVRVSDDAQLISPSTLSTYQPYPVLGILYLVSCISYICTMDVATQIVRKANMRTAWS